MPESPNSPRNLYPGWPLNHSEIKANRAHALVQEMARNVLELTFRATVGSIAERCGLNSSTISDLTKGTSWPTVETLAKIEVGLGQPVWPRMNPTTSSHGSTVTHP
ncbi:helix-turn-helix domain-containing protein [Corynebacterium diphtheriae]|uniref:XRE family transcriptional regulator n=1 Tax=Corynebacterium diphtheriae TaxID=1717 RepID=A0A811G4H2_CORDP|nr:helix-turn-helix transcriptional regulator [Corynebacterium diphtheriae]AEX70290.1 hypothetical protein CDPW8_1638 [Corynebacterium diphtheriae PW8]MBG9222699.1 helix-turn-helix transcriptional regulator [Corynebacterium diphtheriae bv. mitis]MBG9302166.1 helix-turn-helix transcriptional regulator [Corynebacterium diphtheriae bv. mitis]OFI59129.1 hypothetical protein BKD85_02630 [Corynebacterium diphtheriae]OFI65589.1 hypothetical protein BKD81_02625 [Corynebacterium diphtheriae]